MSRRPGIGAAWLDKFESDVYPGDKMFLSGGSVVRPPRYYDERWKKRDCRGYSLMKKKRVAAVVQSEQTTGRLIAKRINAERLVADRLRRNLK